MKLPSAFLILLICMTLASPGMARSLLVATTTSTENSGLLTWLRPHLEQALGLSPRFIVTGSGRALRLGMNRDVDLLWVHDDLGETRFMNEGYGLRREKLMYNRFLLVGPANDPAGVTNAKTIIDAFDRIRKAHALFVSRGDDSGTHRRERSIWRTLDSTLPLLEGKPVPWYRELGSGMGATLNTAIAMNAYTLIDEATWLRHGASKHRLIVVSEGDPMLRNEYSLLIVRSEAEDKIALAGRLVDWLLSDTGQSLIASYRLRNRQAFFLFANKRPNARQ